MPLTKDQKTWAVLGGLGALLLTTAVLLVKAKTAPGGLTVSISPTSVSGEGTASVTASGGTPHGLFNLYAVNATIQTMLYPIPGQPNYVFDKDGNATVTVDFVLCNSGTGLPSGTYTLQIADTTAGKLVDGTVFTCIF